MPVQRRGHSRLALDTGQRQRHGRKAAVNHTYQPALRQPTTHLRHHLPRPVHTNLGPARTTLLGKRA
jgi:hypothetical protein